MICLISVILAAGCSRTNRVEQMQRGEQAEIDVFLHEHLPQQPTVTVAEAYRVFLLIADGDENYTTYEERAAELERRCWVRPEWKLCPQQSIDKGTAAYIVIRMIRGEKGVNSLTFGRIGIGDRRYALRDLVYMGLIDNAPAYRFITGGEMLDLMGQIDEYMARHKMYPSEPVDIKEEMDRAATQPAQPVTPGGETAPSESVTR